MVEKQIVPRTLLRVVFGYAVECFPGALILGYHQLKRMFVRAGFVVKVSMSPLSDLPPDTNLLLVPTALAEEARRGAFDCQIEVLEDFLNAPIYSTLIHQLTESIEWTAPKIVGQTTPNDDGEIVNYRGYERVE
ncbi:MAG: hypothetical protein HY868_08795 [Chloroflexi bacterium]|nr:hypothetical protein [Chloroflexota bacterium]